MRYALLIHQNTEGRNGLSEENEDVFRHATSEIIAELSETGEWVCGEGS